MIKCTDFEINCGNSDAKCFVDSERNYEFLSKCRLIKNKKLCNHCAYNKKFKNFSYIEFEEYKLNLK